MSFATLCTVRIFLFSAILRQVSNSWRWKIQSSSIKRILLLSWLVYENKGLLTWCICSWGVGASRAWWPGGDLCVEVLQELLALQLLTATVARRDRFLTDILLTLKHYTYGSDSPSQWSCYYCPPHTEFYTPVSNFFINDTVITIIAVLLALKCHTQATTDQSLV